MSGPSAQLSALYIHLGLRITTISTGVVKEDIREEAKMNDSEGRILTPSFLFSGLLINHK